MDAARELAQLLEALAELLGRFVEDLGGLAGCVLDPRAGEAQLQRDSDEALLGAVVQVALEAPARRVAGLDEPRARGGELVAGVRAGECKRYELGEALEACFAAVGSGSSREVATTSRPQTRPATTTGAATTER